ncbi:MAG: NupC/NupG family nucleoside CNT transporter [Deltaproteobacteria bacterium]|nr:NupC/NupG family nucleoside CNT transporter [Deltaproteobacteria bacterium]
MSELGARAVSAFGLLALVAIAWACSADRRRMPWRTVAWGLGLQFGLALVLLRSAAGRSFFAAANAVVDGLTRYTEAGVRFVFGALLDGGFSLALNVLPVIVFMGSLFAILFHLGIVQWLVRGFAALFTRTLGTSGAESLSAAADIFVGMVEAPLLVRAYVERMTRSELFTVMATGMATVAGSVLVVYAGMLGEGYAGHLLTASFLAAPGAILLAKVMIPETGAPLTAGTVDVALESPAANLVDAAALGALAGLRLAAYVGALLVAFVALIAFANDALAAAGGWLGVPGLSFQRILGWGFAPLALLIGVAPADATTVGGLLGVKTVLNEFLAYQELAKLVESGAIAPRSAVLASYALCGFANFGSLAILLGGLGGMAPARRADIAALGLRSILAGTLATLMAAAWAGILL